MPKRLFARAPVDAQEERRIRKLAGARHAPADWSERSMIITLSWAGNSCLDIAEKLGCHPRKVRRWINRFNGQGLDGLGDRPGVGRKRRITEEERSRVIALVAQIPPGRPARRADGQLQAEDESGPGVWTLNALTDAARAEGIDIHRSQVRRILAKEKVRWRHPRSWASSKDPDFAPKGPGSWSSTLSHRRTPP
jgi:transposase